MFAALANMFARAIDVRCDNCANARHSCPACCDARRAMRHNTKGA